MSHPPAARLPLAVALCGALSLGACSGDSTDSMTPATDDAPPPGQGFQYVMTSRLDTGQEIERCRFFVAPPEGFYVNHDKVRYTPGSHHVLLYATPYTSIPTKDLRGQVHDTSSVFDCAQGATADWQVTGVLAGAQSFNADSLVDLPADVGIKVPGGAVLLMNTHYLNATGKMIETTAKVNIYTMPASQVKQEGGVLFFYNPFIRVPGMGKASARLRCPVSSDITLANVQSHMHRRGVDYVANWLDDKGALIEQLYENKEWESVPVKSWSPGKVLRAGTAIDYRCDYQNQEARTVLQGGSTRDEMCVLVGSYYPRNVKLESCGDATFVGSGAASCGDTLACLQSQGSKEDGFFGCMVNSCAASANELTAVLRCRFSQGGGACQGECMADMAKCEACLAQACQPALAACAQARCQ